MTNQRSHREAPPQHSNTAPGELLQHAGAGVEVTRSSDQTRPTYAKIHVTRQHSAPRLVQGTHLPSHSLLTPPPQASSPPTPPTSRPSPSVSQLPSQLVVRYDYSKGDILWIPQHEPTTMGAYHCERRTLTAAGPVYSIYRMGIVLFPFASTLVCLPCYTWSNRGLISREASERHEYVEVKNTGSLHRQVGPNRPVEVMCAKPLLPETTIHLTAPVKVAFGTRFRCVGRLEKGEWEYLARLYWELYKAARDTPWEAGTLVGPTASHG